MLSVFKTAIASLVRSPDAAGRTPLRQGASADVDLTLGVLVRRSGHGFGERRHKIFYQGEKPILQFYQMKKLALFFLLSFHRSLVACYDLSDFPFKVFFSARPIASNSRAFPG